VNACSEAGDLELGFRPLLRLALSVLHCKPRPTINLSPLILIWTIYNAWSERATYVNTDCIRGAKERISISGDGTGRKRLGSSFP
jgi:hypothetical protein